MLEKEYEEYLRIIDNSIQKFFAQQTPYIFCKEGCSLCCESGEYPFSKLEFEYAMMGYNKLSPKEQNIIQDRIKTVLKQRKNSNEKPFLYECPFLINKKCSIYKYRGITCRTHGLMYWEISKNDELVKKIPNCVSANLNYSSVYDKKTKTISSKKWEESNINAEPCAYNLGRNMLLNNNMTQKLGLDFEEEKTLIDWFL